MEKRTNLHFIKKLLIVFVIFTVLQSYLASFSLIATAIEEVVTEEDESTVVTGGDEDLNLPVENPTEDPVVTEEQPSDEPEDETETIEEEQVPEETVETEVMEETEIAEEVQEPVEDEEFETEPEEPTEVIEGELEEVIEEVEPEEQEPYVEPEVTLLEVNSENSSIYKGYLYANATSDLRYATNYNTITRIAVVGGKNISRLEIVEDSDRIGLINNAEIALHSDMTYRHTSVNIDEFYNIFGENGHIEIYNPEGELIGYIDSNSIIQNDEYVFYYPTQINAVRYEFIGIENDGEISLNSDKCIKESSVYSRNQISLFTSINSNARVNLFKTVETFDEEGNLVNNEEVKNYNAEGMINLEETESNMIVDISNTVLSVEEVNEVSINVTMKTDQEKYDLFENPSIDLEFPSAVESIEVTGMNLLYRNGLSISNWNIFTNQYGKQVLRINLSGSQLEYTPGALQEGTTVVIYANVKVNRLTADTQEALKMTYTNKDTIRKTYMLEGKDSEDIDLSFVGRAELVRALTVRSGENTETTYDDDTKKIEILADNETAQSVTLNGSIVNNFETGIDEVYVIGRIPFVGNKDGNGNDLSSSFDTTLETGIATNGIIADVYYSEDGEAEKNSESWTQNITDISKYKSYKIVIREPQMAKGEKMSFEFNVQVPAKVGYNQKAYSTYTTYYKIDNQDYTNTCTSGIYTEIKEIEMEDIKEEDRQDLAVLTVGTQVSQGGRVLSELDSVYERQVVKYTFVVRNTSGITANNVVIKANAENANIYGWNFENLENYQNYDVYTVKYMYEYSKEEKEFEIFNIESLKPGESKTYEYQVITDKTDGLDKEVYGKISISADSFNEINVNTIKNKIESADLSVRIESNSTEDLNSFNFNTNSLIGLKALINNISSETLNNVEYKLVLPKGYNIAKESLINAVNNTVLDDEIEYTVEEKNDTTIINFLIPTLKPNDELRMVFKVRTPSIDYTTDSTDMMLYSYLQYNDNKIYSNEFSRKIYQSETKIDFNLTADVDKEYVENNDIIVYNLNIKNIGNVDSKSIKIDSELPNGLILNELNIISSNSDKNEHLDNINTDEIDYEFVLEKDEEKTFQAITKVNSELLGLDQTTIDFGYDITYAAKDDYKTNIISYKVKNNVVSKKQVVIPENNNDTDNNNNNIHDNNDSNNINNTNNSNINNNNNYNNDNYNNNINNEQNNNVINESKVTISTYSISGKAWIDSNRNGINNKGESGKEAVVVMLYGATTNGGIDTNSLVSTTVTNEKGEYLFTGVEKGNYVIVFDYDSSLFNVTKFQVGNAKTSENSDVVAKKVTINGSSAIYGITDVLTIDNSGLINIDIGLISKMEFDLSLDKSIESASVTNDEGTKTYNFTNGKNTKLEIRSKYYRSSTVDITYIVKVKNDGEITGYVNKLVDYIPSGMTFDSNKNEGWYRGEQGRLYYNGLAGIPIESGEEKEIKLILTQSLANGEAIKISNSAEIMESTNSLGIEDYDSIVGNGSSYSKEDDYSSAILQISISTGQAPAYIATILMIIIILLVILYLAYKIKSTKKVYR